MAQEWQRALPEAQGSVTVKKCTRELFRSEVFTVSGTEYQIRVTADWDDRCGNGSNTFCYHTQVVLAYTNAESQLGIHDQRCAAACSTIPKHILDSAKWNGCHPFGPWYYIENTVYHAGDRDCNGLRAGEKRQIVNGRTGKPSWRLMAVDGDGNEIDPHSVTRYLDSDEQPPCPYRMEYRPWWRVGEGKKRELDYARSTAIWPDATDEQLMDDNLAEALKARLPALLVEFRQTLEALGFTW